MTTMEEVLRAIPDSALRDRVAYGWGLRTYRPMDYEDPAQVLVSQGGFTVPTIYRQGCLICMDPEYALMGMTLCRPCPVCNGHIPGDDTTCDDCAYDLMDGDYEIQTPVEAWYENSDDATYPDVYSKHTDE